MFTPTPLLPLRLYTADSLTRPNVGAGRRERSDEKKKSIGEKQTNDVPSLRQIFILIDIKKKNEILLTASSKLLRSFHGILLYSVCLSECLALEVHCVSVIQRSRNRGSYDGI